MSHSWALSQDWWGLCWPDPFSLRDPHPMFQGCRGWSEVLPLSLVSWPGEPGGGWDHDECLWAPVSVCDLEKCLSPHSPESLTPQSSASHFIFLLNHQSPLCYWSSSKKKLKGNLEVTGPIQTQLLAGMGSRYWPLSRAVWWTQMGHLALTATTPASLFLSVLALLSCMARSYVDEVWIMVFLPSVGPEMLFHKLSS